MTSELIKLFELAAFKELTESETTWLANRCVSKKCTKDEFIFYPEDLSHTIFFISDGRVKLGAYSKEGKEMITHIFFQNEMFGIMAISNQKNRANYAKAMDNDTQICTIDVFDIKELMQKNAMFTWGISKILGDRLVQFQERIESLMFKDTFTRVTDLLKEFAKKQGKLIGDEVLIKHNLTHQDFASLTATTRQTVTSILNDLKKQDLIYMERGKMLIRNMDKLNELD
jgi:CRP/FNR family cyclic AMP-dependent transcriptional regulator